MAKDIRLTRSNCTHHWIIEGAHVVHLKKGRDGVARMVRNGKYSPGTCSKCGESRRFDNQLPTKTELTL